MNEKPATHEPKRRRYQFSLRTLLIVVAALAVLFAQWPLVERTAVIEDFTTRHSDGTETVQRFDTGHYFVPNRVIAVVAIELILLGCWVSGLLESD